jgi:signal transduction histidine kinase
MSLVFMTAASPPRRWRHIGPAAGAPPQKAGAATNFGRYRRRTGAPYGGRVEDLSCYDDRARHPGRAITAALTAGLVVLTASAVLPHATHAGVGLLSLDIAAGVISCALVPVLLGWPAPGGLMAAMAVLTVLAAVSPAATPAVTAGALVVAEWRRFAVAIRVAAAGIAAQAVQGLWRPASGLSFVWWLVLVIAAYAAVLGWGQSVQARRALLNSLRERARRAEAEQGRRVAEAQVAERARIAAEMHDVLAHRLSLVAMYAGALEYRPDSAPQEIARAAGIVREGVHQALGELREVIGVLREPDRPPPALTDIPKLVAESHDAGQQVSLDDRMTGAGEVPPACGRAAYWVVREGLTNARKHAAGQPVQVRLDGRPGTALTIDITNPLPPDGAARAARAASTVGAASAVGGAIAAGAVGASGNGAAGGHAGPSLPGAGAGLAGLSERVLLAGGQLDHEVTPAAGFQLHASLPWPQ